MDRLLLLLIVFAVIPLKSLGQNDLDFDTSQVYVYVDSMPTMNDGLTIQDKLLQLFIKDFNYPDSLNCLISNLIFEFVVSYNGALTDKKITFRPYEESCNDDIEKLRKAGLNFLDRFPLCKPGKLNGKNVKVKFIVPVIICLQ